VVFEPARPSERRREKAEKDKDAEAPRIRSAHTAGRDRPLKRELESTREYLQSVTSSRKLPRGAAIRHEEVQSANEELQSTNEDWRLPKEEIQSANEELSTATTRCSTPTSS